MTMRGPKERMEVGGAHLCGHGCGRDPGDDDRRDATGGGL